METAYQSVSIIHIQNVFLVNPINIYIKRENDKYIIGYEPKRHTFHYLKYMVDKTLISKLMFNKENIIEIKNAVDINVKKILREFSEKWEFNVKNIVMRIIPTEYNNSSKIYGIIYQFHYRKTGGGGLNKIEFTIPECPIITNSTNITNICYKLVSKQISASSSHQLHTYLLVAPSRGQYNIGNHIRISNINQNGHRNMHVYPIIITL